VGTNQSLSSETSLHDLLVALVSRDGQLHFFHDYLRQAVWMEYLDESCELEAAHERLAQTVTRWCETCFGPTLRAYGFAYGIGHLR
jgi:hypothetical protein